MCRSCRAVAEAVVLLVLVAGNAAVACGPFFPNRMLLDGDESLLQPPVASFRVAIERLAPEVPDRLRARSPREIVGRARELYGRGLDDDQVRCAELLDLQACLERTEMPEIERDSLMHEYDRCRGSLQAYRTRLDRWQEMRAVVADYLGNGLTVPERWRRYWQEEGLDPDASQPPVLPALDVPPGLPAEFRLYLEGAVAYHSGRSVEAEARWNELLALPGNLRRFRSTWAAFMLGRLLMEERPGEAVQRFSQVRDLVTAGYHDSLGLAAAGLGWEGRVHLDQWDYPAALKCYLQQYAADDPTALASLRVAARECLNAEPAALEEVVRDAQARGVVTAYLLSRFRSWEWQEGVEHAWLTALEAAGVTDVREAADCGWLAYQVAAYELARRWLARAPENEPMARWLRAKLCLRDGKPQEAARELAAVVRGLPVAETVDVWGTDRLLTEPGWDLDEIPMGQVARAELGVLRLAAQQYEEALDTLVKGGFWADAAYVAERVLTCDELRAYVDRVSAEHGPGQEDSPGSRIRYLLGRRLVREGRRRDAGAYLPQALRARLFAYATALEQGGDPARTDRQRAGALWQAALILRYEGMELMGTEVEPDWFVYNGAYSADPASTARAEPAPDTVVRASADEQARAQEHAPAVDRRFHYRYLAAHLGSQAAALLPDNTDLTAKLLVAAGSWLKDRDPQAADVYYKQLVRRCGRTELGRNADELRWFPREVGFDPHSLLLEFLLEP